MDRDLAAQLLADGSGRFDGAGWQVSARAANLSWHERQHRILNDLTSYGALLDAVGRLSRTDERLKPVFTGLVNRCRTVHECYATYLGFQGGLTTDMPAALAGNDLYTHYYRRAERIVSLPPFHPVGLLALSAVARFSMNGRLPEKVERGELSGIRLSDFRAADAPDHRFTLCERHLDRTFWEDCFHKARAGFGEHPHWRRFIERHAGTVSIHDVFNPVRVGNQIQLGSGGIDPRFETDVGNFIVDQVMVFLKERGMTMYLLTERRQLEGTIRAAVPERSDRFYDRPEEFARFNARRDAGREAIVFRSTPMPTEVSSVSRATDEDWSAYRRIGREEGYAPVYLSAVDDFLREHGLPASAAEALPATEGVVCFLRRKAWLPDGSIGLRVHVVPQPRNLMTVAVMVEGIRVCLSGKLLLPLLRTALDPWADVIDGWPLTVLLDADPSAVLRALDMQYVPLFWHIEHDVAGSGADLLFLCPIPVDGALHVTFFRPCTGTSGDAVLRMLDPPAIPAVVKAAGARIVGLPEEALERPWTIHEDGAWTASRYVSEIARFTPASPEDMLDGQ